MIPLRVRCPVCASRNAVYTTTEDPPGWVCLMCKTFRPRHPLLELVAVHAIEWARRRTGSPP